MSNLIPINLKSYTFVIILKMICIKISSREMEKLKKKKKKKGTHSKCTDISASPDGVTCEFQMKGQDGRC